MRQTLKFGVLFILLGGITPHAQSSPDSTSHLLCGLFSADASKGFVLKCSSKTAYSAKASKELNGIEGDVTKYVYVQQGVKWRLDKTRQIKGLPERQVLNSFDGTNYSQFRSADGNYMTSSKQGMLNVPRAMFPLLEPFSQFISLSEDQKGQQPIANGSASYSPLPADLDNPSTGTAIAKELAEAALAPDGTVQSKYLQGIIVITRFAKDQAGLASIYPSSYTRILPNGKVALEITTSSGQGQMVNGLPKTIKIKRYMDGEVWATTELEIDSLEILIGVYADFQINPAQADSYYNLDTNISINSNVQPTGNATPKKE